ncbi:MAG: hypothetical protein ABI859_12400 [Pseudomonadota bacterium]
MTFKIAHCPLSPVVAAVASLSFLTGIPHGWGAEPKRDIGGMWEKTHETVVNRQPVPWTDEGMRLWKEDLEKHWHGGVSEENTFCLPAGMPFMMSGSEGFDIAQNSREILIVNEERPSPRHIYIDGRKHPDMAIFDRTTVGHSIGHWEGDTLVVDTVGFLPGGTVLFVRSEGTHLVERYRLEDNGKHLRIVFTWTDPKILAKPYVQEYVMDRAPPDRTAQEYYCDPRAPERAVP